MTARIAAALRQPRGFVLVPLVAVLFAGLPTALHAQGNNDPARRELVDDLLKNLIESELQRLENRGTTQPQTPQTPIANISNPRQVHTMLTSFSQQIRDLSFELAAEVRNNPGIRTLLNDLYTLRARSALWADKTSQGDAWKQDVAEIQTIDRDWRVLSFKLRQIPNLSQKNVNLIAKLDKTSQDLMGLLKVRPQLNYYEMTRTLASLNVDFGNLLEDIEMEIGSTGDGRNFLLEGRKTQQQIRHLGFLVRDEVDYEVLVEEYGRFSQLWDPLASKLQSYNNRFIERSLRRISDSTRAMHELLQLPHEIDKQKLLYLTNLLKKDVDEFFARTPLKLLIELPDSEYVLASADAFYGVCENFTDIVQRGASHQDMIDAFRYIEESEDEFNRLFKPIRSQTALSVLTSIDRHVDELRESLVLNEDFDRKKAVELAASLENLSEHLHLDTRLWLSHVQVGYKEEALQATANFSEMAANFHRDVLAGANVNQLRRQASDLYDGWRRVHGYISLSTNEDRAHLARLASHIGPNLVEIRTLVQQ